MRSSTWKVLGRLRVTGFTAAIILLASVGTALAATNSVHVKVPENAKVSVAYAIKIRGTAPNGGQLYLFVDYQKCGSSPAVEYARTGKGGGAYGIYWANVSGTFKKKSGGWTSKLRGKDHACVYLTDIFAPKNASTGVLAHASRSYQIH